MFLQPQLVAYQGVWSGLYGTTKVPEPIPLSSALESKVNETFALFIDCLVEKERESPSGLLRPGIVDIAKRLYALQHTTPPVVKGVCIYSNNGNLAFLHLAGKLIEKLANAPGLFCSYVHWFHPLRRSEIQWGSAGSGLKTTRVLQQIFQECFPGETIPLDNLYFFDDLVHPNLYGTLLSRYFQVPVYKFDADHTRLDECFKTAMESTGLAEDPEYLRYVSPLRVSSYQDILQTIQNDVRTYQRKTIVPNNSTLRTRFNRTFPKPPTSKAAFTKALQTFRQFETKLNTGSLLTNEEQARYREAQSIVTNYEANHPNTAGGKRSGLSKRRSKTQKRRRHR